MNSINADVFSYELDIIAQALRIDLEAPSGNNKVFILKDIYNNHTDIAAEAMLKARNYNQPYIRSIKNLMKDYNLSDEDIFRMVFCVYKDAPQRRPLSKFISDIYQQVRKK